MKTFIYDLKTRENMRLYYASKERFGEKLIDKSQFISDVSHKIRSLIQQEKYDFLVIPESSKDFIENIAKQIGIPYFVIKKNSVDFITNNIEDLKLQKAERSSHLVRIEAMDRTFKINILKANQRRKYKDLLFEKTPLSHLGKGIILDDSLFSGTTYEGLKGATGIEDYIMVFSK